MSDWFVAETLPRAEFRAQENVERQGFASFLPRFLRTRRHARRIDHVLTPVFPGYLFVSFDLEGDPWRAINSTFGVRRLVSFRAERPQPMPHAVMRALMARCEAQTITRQLPDLVAGDEVRVIAGALADKIGRIEEIDGKGRVAILMDLLGRPVSVKLDPGILGPVAC